MKAPSASAVLSVAALSSTAHAAFSMNIARDPASKLKTRNLKKRASLTESLVNNVTGGDYVAKVSVGTPPQQVNLAIDTGSSDVWVISSSADLCTSASLQQQYTDGCTSVCKFCKSIPMDFLANSLLQMILPNLRPSRMSAQASS